MEITGRRIRIAKGDTGTIIISLRQGCKDIPSVQGQKAVFIIKDQPETPDSQAMYTYERRGKDMQNASFSVTFNTDTTSTPGRYRWALRLEEDTTDSPESQPSFHYTLAEGTFEVYQGTFA